MSFQIREKSYFGEKFQLPSNHLLPYGILKNDNSESLIFFGIAKIVIDLVGFGRHKINLVYFF